MGPNCVRLGDVVEVNPYWPRSYPDVHFTATVRAFETCLGRQVVRVEPIDPLTLEDADALHPFGALSLVSA